LNLGKENVTARKETGEAGARRHGLRETIRRGKYELKLGLGREPKERFRPNGGLLD